MAAFIDVTPHRVRQLRDQGILKLARDVDGSELKGRYQLFPNNIAYIRYLRQQRGMQENASQSEYEVHRNRQAAANAERSELELKLFKGQVHRWEDIEVILTQRITAAKQRILAIASRTARIVTACTVFDKNYNTIYTECESACNEIASLNAGSFMKQTLAYLKQLAREKAGSGKNGE
jgi:hypothetical protein